MDAVKFQRHRVAHAMGLTITELEQMPASEYIDWVQYFKETSGGR